MLVVVNGIVGVMAWELCVCSCSGCGAMMVLGDGIVEVMVEGVCCVGNGCGGIIAGTAAA